MWASGRYVVIQQSPLRPSTALIDQDVWISRLEPRGQISNFVSPLGCKVALSSTLTTVRHRLESYGAEMRKSSSLSCSRLHPIRWRANWRTVVIAGPENWCWNCQADSLRAFVCLGHSTSNLLSALYWILIVTLDAREESAAASSLDTDADTVASMRSRPCAMGHSAGVVCGLDALHTGLRFQLQTLARFAFNMDQHQCLSSNASPDRSAPFFSPRHLTTWSFSAASGCHRQDYRRWAGHQRLAMLASGRASLHRVRPPAARSLWVSNALWCSLATHAYWFSYTAGSIRSSSDSADCSCAHRYLGRL